MPMTRFGSLHFMIYRVNFPIRICSDEEQIIGTLADMAKTLPDVISAASTQALKDGLSERVIRPLAEALTAHANERLASISARRR